MADNSESEKSKKKVIEPGPVPGMPITQPDKDKKRPSLGSGAAEDAAKDLEKSKKDRKKKMKELFGDRKPNNGDG